MRNIYIFVQQCVAAVWRISSQCNTYYHHVCGPNQWGGPKWVEQVTVGEFWGCGFGKPSIPIVTDRVCLRHNVAYSLIFCHSSQGVSWNFGEGAVFSLYDWCSIPSKICPWLDSLAPRGPPREPAGIDTFDFLTFWGPAQWLVHPPQGSETLYHNRGGRFTVIGPNMVYSQGKFNMAVAYFMYRKTGRTHLFSPYCGGNIVCVSEVSEVVGLFVKLHMFV